MRRSQVVVIAGEPVEPRPLVARGERGGGSLGEAAIREGVPPAERLLLAARGELFGGEVADGPQHEEAGLTDALHLADEAVVDERLEAVEHIAADLGGRAAHRLRLGQLRATNEHG